MEEQNCSPYSQEVKERGREQSLTIPFEGTSSVTQRPPMRPHLLKVLPLPKSIMLGTMHDTCSGGRLRLQTKQICHRNELIESFHILFLCQIFGTGCVFQVRGSHLWSCWIAGTGWWHGSVNHPGFPVLLGTGQHCACPGPECRDNHRTCSG